MFNRLSINKIDSVGGKNASLGEMISELSEPGVKVPDGFTTTTDAFLNFLAQIKQWIIDTPFLQSLLDDITQAWQQLMVNNRMLKVRT